MKKNIFTALLLLPTILMAQTTLTNGLKAYYKFDGNYADSSGNNNNGVNNNIQFTSDRKGKANGAASFNGTSSYISVPASLSLNSINADISVSTWVYVTGWFNWAGFKFAPIICKSQINSATQYRFSILDSAFDLIANTKSFYQPASTAFNTGTWYHVAASRKGDSCSFYVNGSLVQSTKSAGTYPSDSTQPLEIGRDYAGSIEYLNGSLDELRIYNRALTNQEVTDLYNFTNTSVFNLNNKITPNFIVYPNPTNGKLNIKNSSIDFKHIEIMNSIGQTVFESSVFQEEIELNDTHKGVYIIRLTDKSGIKYSQKVIVE